MDNQSQSLTTGAALTRETWANFVTRLRHDCVGDGVHDHYTADAIFIVEARRFVYGVDEDYTEKRVVYCDDCEWFSPQEYWDDCDEHQHSRLNHMAQESGECDFLQLDVNDQWDTLGDLEDHHVVGYDERWEYVNSHFTKDAAEAFIRRKKHDYPKGLRVYVDAQTYCWEFNTIKEAIMSGCLGLVEQVTP